MTVNASLPPRWTNRPHDTPNYRPVKSKLEVEYYIQTHFSPEKLAHIRTKLEKKGQEVIYSSKGFNNKYLEFVGYDTSDKLIWISGKGCISTTTISKQGISKINMNMKSPSSILGFGFSPQKNTCDILS